MNHRSIRYLTLIFILVGSIITIFFIVMKPAHTNPITFIELRSYVFGWNWFNTGHILHYSGIIVIGFENFEIPVFFIIIPFIGHLAVKLARILGVI